MADVNININIQDEIAKGRMVDFTNDVEKGLAFIADKAKLSTSAVNDLTSSIRAQIGVGVSFSQILKEMTENSGKYSTQVREAAKSILNFTAGNEEFLKKAAQVKPVIEEQVSVFEKLAKTLGIESTGAIKGFITGMLGMGIIGGVGLQIGREFAEGIHEIISTAADASKEIGKLTSITGMSAQEAQVWAKAAEFSGESAEEVSQSMRTLSRALTDNTGVGKTAQKALEDLGVTYRNVRTGELLPMDDIFRSIIDRLHQMGPGAQETKDAVEALGRAGINILPLVANFDELKGVVELTGSTLSSDQLKIGTQYRLQSFIFHEAVTSMKNDLSSLLESLLTVEAHVPGGARTPIKGASNNSPNYLPPGTGGVFAPAITSEPINGKAPPSIFGGILADEIGDNNRAIDVAMSNLNPKLAAAEGKLNELRAKLKRDVLPEVNAPILAQIEAQRAVVDKIKEDLKKKPKDPLDRSGEVEEQNAAAHYAHLATISHNAIEGMLDTERGLVQERLQLIDSPYARAIAVAGLEVELAQKKQQLVGAINQSVMDREIAALKRKEEAIPAGDKHSAADIERIEGQIQGVRDRYALLNIQLATEVAKAKANLSKTESEESRKLADALAKGTEQDEKKKEEADQRHAVSITATNKIIETEAQRHAVALVKIHDEQLQAQFDLGLITQNKLLNLRQKELDDEYKAQLAAIAKERTLLDEEVKDKGSDLYANRKAGIDSKESGIVDDHKVKSAANSTAILKNEIKQVGNFLHPISTQFVNALNSWITGTKTFGQAFANMGRGILTSWINTLLQMGVEWAEKHATMFILHEAFNLGLIASDVKKDTSATAADLVATKARATIDISTAAAIGGANALAYWAAVDPPLAPALAAVTYGEIMSFNAISAAGGADLPNSNTFGFLHPREMVLPQKYADVIRGISNNNTNSSRNVKVGNINYNAKSSMGQREFRNMMTSTMRNLNV